MGSSCLGLLLFADTCWIVAMSPGKLQTFSRAWNELLQSGGSPNQLGRGGVVLDGTRPFGSKHHCVGNSDHSTNTKKGLKRLVYGSLSMVTSQENWPSVR